MNAVSPGAPPARIAALVLAFFVLAGVGAAMYWPCLDAPLIWDDHTFVAGQSFLRDPSNLFVPLSETGFIRVLPVRGAARPLWLSSVLADRSMLGGGARIHRLVNMLWHAVGSWVLLCLLLAMTGDLAASLAGALLYLTHPSHVETVVMVTYRADLMAFFFVTTAAWLVYESGRVERGFYPRAAAVACIGLALLSKETAVVSPLLLYCVDPLRAGAGRRRLYLALGAMILLYALFYAPRAGYSLSDRTDAVTTVSRKFPKVFAVTSAPLKPATSPRLAERPDPPPWSEGQPVRLRILSGFRAQGRALVDLVWPFHLTPDPAPRPARSIMDPAAWSGAALMGCLLLAAWRFSASAPLASAGLAWVPLSLLPYIGLMAVKNTRGDRYLLFATAGVAMAASAAIARISGASRRRAALWCAFLIAGGWGIAARARLPDYADDEAFYRATLARDPVAPRARLGLALLFVDNHSPEAERELRRAVDAWPGSRSARMYLAYYLASKHRGAEAVEIFEALVRERPDDDAARWRLAQARAEFARPELAIRAYDDLLARRPDFWPADREAGRLLVRLGRYREAVARLKAAAYSRDLATLDLLQVACRRAGMRKKRDEKGSAAL